MKASGRLQLFYLGAAILAFAGFWFSVRTYYSRYYGVASRHGVMSRQEHARRLERALEYDPSYGYGHLLRAQLLMKTGKPEQAREAQLEGMKSYRTVQGLLQLGSILERLKKTEEARQAYEKAATVAPSHVTALERLAVLAYSAGDTTRTEQLAAEIARVDLNNPNPPYLRALLAERAGNPALAYRYYQRVSAAGPPRSNAFYDLHEVRQRLELLRPQVENR